MAITHGLACKTALAQALSDFADLGGGATLRVFDGLGTTLVTMALQYPGAFTAAAGAATLNGAPSGIATNTGEPATFDIINGNSDTVYEGTAGAAGSGADLELNTGSLITDGQTVTLTSHVWELTA